MLTRTIAPTLTKVKTYIPDNLLNRLIMALMMMAPTIEANGRIPIRIDCAMNLSIEML